MRECLKCHEKGEAPEVKCKKRPGTHLVINPVLSMEYREAQG